MQRYSIKGRHRVVKPVFVGFGTESIDDKKRNSCGVGWFPHVDS
jgi:hypothetical protein